jgi:glycosyltransferase involved in cell wall biosynthesis
MTLCSESTAPAAGIAERNEHGLLILSPVGRKPHRRVLFTNCSGGAAGWSRVKQGLMPSNRFWGCRELVDLGYEVGIAEAFPDFYLHRNPLPHDLKLLGAIRNWLGRDGIIYCAHNVQYWVPFLKALGLVRCQVVSLLYAREPLNQVRGHTGIIGLNPSAADHAKKLAPKAKVAHLGWGMDLNFYPQLPYASKSFLSCGRSNRDDRTLCRAIALSSAPIRIIWHQENEELQWPAHVDLVKGGPGWESRLSYHDLLHDFYSEATASLIVVKKDMIEYTACGFTGLLEAMVMGRPAIMTRTGAVPSEIDLDKSGCGIYVPPENPEALAEAIRFLANSPAKAQAMGEAGRRLCESHYNMNRFATDLHHFFESL